MRNLIVTCVFFMVTIMIGCGAPLDITKTKEGDSTVLWGNLEVVDSDCDGVFAETLEEVCRNQMKDVSFSDCMTSIVQKCAVNTEDLSQGFWKDCFDSEMSLKGPRSRIYFGDCDDTDSEIGLTGSETRSCVEGVEIGTETRTCTMGVWEDWSDVTCIFCTDGQSESRNCGLNDRGSQTRICIEDVWSNYSECTDTDICVDGASQTLTCGLNNRGSQTQLCVMGQWSEPSSCIDDDICIDGSTQTLPCGINGNGVDEQTCTDGQWISNEGCVDDDVCENGLTQTLYCGINGNGVDEQTCTDGQWISNEGCVDDDVCENGSTQTLACGINGNGTDEQTCTDGQWISNEGCVDDEVCLNDSTRTINCGINGNGVDEQTCTDGQWISNEGCVDDDVCENGLTQALACGINLDGTDEQTCTDGQWISNEGCVDDDVCENGSIQTLVCGLNSRGEQTQLCVEGTFSDPSACIDPDTCVDGSTTKSDDGDYLLCQEGSLELISCTVEDHCWEYASSFGFVETIFDTQVSCIEDTDCENAVCEAGSCVRIFDHFNGENFGCLPSGVCGTCSDADADGICGGGSTGPETCESNADCLSGQVCTPQGVCVNYPDPATCFPFRIVLPADTNASMMYMWNSEGQLVDGAPKALPTAVEGEIVIDSVDYTDVCGITFEYEGRWQSWLDEIFPTGAPSGQVFYTFYAPGELCQVGGNAAWGAAHDKKCVTP